MGENNELPSILTQVSNIIKSIASKFISTEPTKKVAKKRPLSPKKDKVTVEHLMQEGKLHKSLYTNNYVLRNPNTSSTSEESTKIENGMYDQLMLFGNRNNYRSKKFNIPYGDRTITIKPADSTIPLTISVNALDSLAKNAGRADISMLIAMGLPYQETTFGRIPIDNYGKKFDSRALGNSNFFKAFGNIPAEYLVRNFRYNDDLNNKLPISLDIYPLEHAFTYFKEGKYNPGDPNHTSDVLRKGRAVLNENTGNYTKWYKEEGQKYYQEGLNERRNK